MTNSPRSSVVVASTLCAGVVVPAAGFEDPDRCPGDGGSWPGCDLDIPGWNEEPGGFEGPGLGFGLDGSWSAGKDCPCGCKTRIMGACVSCKDCPDDDKTDPSTIEWFGDPTNPMAAGVDCTDKCGCKTKVMGACVSCNGCPDEQGDRGFPEYPHDGIFADGGKDCSPCTCKTRVMGRCVSCNKCDDDDKNDMWGPFDPGQPIPNPRQCTGNIAMGSTGLSCPCGCKNRVMGRCVSCKKCPDEEERNQCYAKQVDKYRWMFEYALADGTGPAANLINNGPLAIDGLCDKNKIDTNPFPKNTHTYASDLDLNDLCITHTGLNIQATNSTLLGFYNPQIGSEFPQDQQPLCGELNWRCDPNTKYGKYCSMRNGMYSHPQDVYAARSLFEYVGDMKLVGSLVGIIGTNGKQVDKNDFILDAKTTITLKNLKYDQTTSGNIIIDKDTEGTMLIQGKVYESGNYVNNDNALKSSEQWIDGDYYTESDLDITGMLKGAGFSRAIITPLGIIGTNGKIGSGKVLDCPITTNGKVLLPDAKGVLVATPITTNGIIGTNGLITSNGLTVGFEGPWAPNNQLIPVEKWQANGRKP